MLILKCDGEGKQAGPHFTFPTSVKYLVIKGVLSDTVEDVPAARCEVLWLSYPLSLRERNAPNKASLHCGLQLETLGPLMGDTLREIFSFACSAQLL